MRFIKPLLGLALLVGLMSLTDIRVLIDHFQEADLGLFGLALLLAIIANLLCVRRWQLIAKEFGVRAPYGFLVPVYAQGISANCVLPGGIVGGDAWRSLAIAKYATGVSKTQGVLSVLLDRVSGFWGLTWLSLAAGVVAFFVGNSTRDASQVWFDSALGQIYLLGLVAIVLAPMLGRFIHLKWLRLVVPNHHNERIQKCLEAVAQITNSLPILTRTVWHSLLIQALSSTVFWLCLTSVSVDISWWLLTALCGGIFLSSVLPAALGGFGARELGAVAFMTPFGFSKESVLAGSVLFGLTATLQGLMGLWFWFKFKADASGGT
jgi:uncharacterized protein (TIRG00374 family)